MRSDSARMRSSVPRAVVQMSGALILAAAVAGCSQRAGTRAVPQIDDPAQIVAHFVTSVATAEAATQQSLQEEFERYCLTTSAPSAPSPAARVALCRAICEQLQRPGARPAKLWLLRQLASIGDAESVTTLSRMLANEDAEIADLARRALQANASDEARLALESKLRPRLNLHRDPTAADVELQIALLDALGARASPRSIEVLTDNADVAPDRVRAAALTALGGVRDARATNALVGLTRTTSTRLYEFPTAWLRSLEYLCDSGGGELARLLLHYFGALFSLDRAAEADNEVWTFRQRQRITLRLAMLPLKMNTNDYYGPAELRDLILSRDEVERAPTDAATALAIQESRLVEALRGYSTRADIRENMRGVAVITKNEGLPSALDELAILGDCVDRDIRPVLLSESAADVAAALRYIAHCGAASYVEPVAVLACCGETPGNRALARHALARMPGFDVNQRILAVARQPGEASARTRAALIRAIADRGMRTAIGELLELATDGESAVRAAAFEALGELGGAASLSAAITLFLANEDEESQSAAEDAVVKLCGKIDDERNRADPLLAALPSATGAERQRAIRALGRVGGSTALVAVRAARREDNPLVIDAAVRALAKWPDAGALADVCEIAEKSTEETHRALALRAFVRLLRLPNQRTAAAQLELASTALKLARNDSERKLAIGALGDVPLRAALDAVLPLLDSAECRAEAAAATVKIARAIAAAEYAAATAAIERVRALDDLPDAVKTSTRDAAEMLTNYATYIANWSYAGPYFVDGKKAADLYDIAFDAEKRGATTNWRPLTARSADNPWIFDFTKLDGGSDRCMYTRACISVPTATPARLLLGTDDGCVVFVNGAQVHRNVVQRGLEPCSDKVNIELQRGDNWIIIKVIQGSGGWGFACGITTRDGKPLDNLGSRSE